MAGEINGLGRAQSPIVYYWPGDSGTLAGRSASSLMLSSSFLPSVLAGKKNDRGPTEQMERLLMSPTRLNGAEDQTCNKMA